MEHRLFTFLLILAIGLQGPAVAFGSSFAMADSASMQMPSDCAMVVGARSHRGHMACCPHGQTHARACLGTCLAAVGITTSLNSVVWQIDPPPAVQSRASDFSSRGDSPLIRPPIL
jgi:hypothetical protein